MSKLWQNRSDADADAIALDRRGVRHGWLDPPSRDAAAPAAAATSRATLPADAHARWAAGEPIHWPGSLTERIEEWQADIESTLEMFERLREGGRWLDECDERVREESPFECAGTTFDRSEPREIERVFAHGLDPEGTRVARELTARLSWIADDESDLSLRVRFSFGHESLREWLDADDPRHVWSAHFAEEVFPECMVLADDSVLDAVAMLHGKDVRLSERIVYANAPGGGAMFHDDGDPAQRGVVYGQLAGHTAWLALPRNRLATAVVAAAPERFADAAAASAALGSADEALWSLLNRDPAFSQRLADAGDLVILEPGDALILPSPDEDPDRACWHSVFAVGAAENLSLSFGVFDAIAWPDEAD